MARKTMHTRQKLVFRIDGLRPRNPLVPVLRGRKGGAHEKSPGAKRQAAKARLRRLVDESE